MVLVMPNLNSYVSDPSEGGEKGDGSGRGGGDNTDKAVDTRKASSNQMSAKP